MRSQREPVFDMPGPSQASFFLNNVLSAPVRNWPVRIFVLRAQSQINQPQKNSISLSDDLSLSKDIRSWNHSRNCHKLSWESLYRFNAPKISQMIISRIHGQKNDIFCAFMTKSKLSLGGSIFCPAVLTHVFAFIAIRLYTPGINFIVITPKLFRIDRVGVPTIDQHIPASHGFKGILESRPDMMEIIPLFAGPVCCIFPQDSTAFGICGRGAPAVNQIGK